MTRGFGVPITPAATTNALSTILLTVAETTNALSTRSAGTRSAADHAKLATSTFRNGTMNALHTIVLTNALITILLHPGRHN